MKAVHCTDFSSANSSLKPAGWDSIVMPYDLNDLVLRGSREIFTTDTEGDHVYRFDRASHRFTEMKLHRPVFYPNGITLSGDGNLLFVADMLGIIRVDLLSDESEDVDPGAHNTLSGIDG